MGFVDENDLGGCDDAERLWAKLKGWYRGEEYEKREHVAAALALQGADAAKIIYRDVKNAAEIKYDHRSTVTNVSLEMSPLGGEDNVPRIQDVLREIGGTTAQKANALLCLIDGIDNSGRAERVLGDAGTPEALYVLSRRLSSSHPAVAKAAAAALSQHREGTATQDLPTLLAALTGHDAKSAIEAATAPEKQSVAENLTRKELERQEAEDIVWWRAGQSSPPRPPEQVRAAILVRFERLDEEVLEWLSWSDADLLALPLDLKQAWVEGPSAWKAALWSTDLWLRSTKHDPQDRPQEVHRAAPFQAAEYAFMKSHLSTADCAWYLAAERVRAMRDEAQAAWEQGPLAWTAFLTPSRPEAAS